LRRDELSPVRSRGQETGWPLVSGTMAAWLPEEERRDDMARKNKRRGKPGHPEGPEQPVTPDTDTKRTPAQWGALAFVASFFVAAPLFNAHVSPSWAAALSAAGTAFVVAVLVNTVVARRRRH
jgi:hypothetical protein